MIAELFLTFFLAGPAPGGGFVPSVARTRSNDGSGGFEIQAASEAIDYPISWALEAGEAIQSSAWSVLPVEDGGMTVSVDSGVIDGTLTACLVTGGLFGRVYRLTNTIVTDQGRTLQETIGIRIGKAA
jgi:hypothetical protein